ncbi:sensor domain-containing diguanylate cyclase [Kosakonia cowanii]
MNNDKEEKRILALYAMGILDTETEERFDRITRLAIKFFNVQIALISLLDKDRQWFKSSCGLDIKSTPRTDSFCTYAVENGEPLIVNDTKEDVRFRGTRLVTQPPYIRFYAGYPVRMPDGEIAGTICIIDNKPRSFHDDELNILRDLAGIVEDEFRIINMAATDSLTGLSNRRSFSMITEEIHKKALRRKIKYCVVIIDLDNFKPINDQFGHSEGNQALIVFAEILEKVSSETCFTSRLGGDEFGILLTQSTLLQANELINSITEEVRKFNETTQKPYRLSFSAGAVEYDSNRHIKPKDIMKEADEKMYLIKRNKIQLLH